MNKIRKDSDILYKYNMGYEQTKCFNPNLDVTVDERGVGRRGERTD